MVNIEIFRPFYSFSREFLKNYFSRLLKNTFKDLDVEFNLSLVKNGLQLAIEGEDWEVVKNSINQIFVSVKNINDIKKNSIYKGYLNSVGEFGYGIYVDIGIRRHLKKDVLIPLFLLRKNLFLNKKFSLRNISNILGFMNNLPINIEIVEVNIQENKILGNLSIEELEKYSNWIKNDNEILLFCGVTLTKIQKTFKELNINRFLLDIKNLDFFEHAVILEEGTSAKGILAKVGKYFKNDISLLNPAKVRNFIDST
ncbi:MAG: DUF2110 family protein [Candidatus Helarchaeota archaeon]